MVCGACPEHWHPRVNGAAGKEETFRCRWVTAYLYVPGEPIARPHCSPPTGSEAYYQERHEIVLAPGDQYTGEPETPHWFPVGDEGTILSEFSTRSTDEHDVFRDPSPLLLSMQGILPALNPTEPLIA